ncbi:hypothetical protein PanWU01x14_286790 [Parasponia andersonii]|uniref:Uncharacterized protein n=1 Tax=Parasponia andersonii TaxID=3476 RepID=A0A2P5AZ29_PARAD|nr:hypothetical protein PanWU01x14_286790 [Parasponia andersonii]
MDALLYISATAVANKTILEEIFHNFYKILHLPPEYYRKVSQPRYPSLVSKLGLLISRAQLQLSTLMLNYNIILRVLPIPQGARPLRYQEHKKVIVSPTTTLLDLAITIWVKMEETKERKKFKPI